MSPYWDRKFRYGGPWPIWINNIDIITKLIKENSIKPIDSEHLFGNSPEMFQVPNVGAKGKISDGLRPYPFPGGLRYPHLHFKGELYKLNDKQWKTFSSEVLKDIRAKLDKVNVVSFEQVMEISDAVDSLGM